MTKIEKLLSETPQTVFTIDDLAVLWNQPDRPRLARVVNYYVRTGRLHSVHKGVYALMEDYSPHEAAIKVFPPAYISFTTALGLHGAYFQYERNIHTMAQASKTITLKNGHTFVYHQLKDKILLNQEGIEKSDSFWLASLERAICDTSYLVPSFAFEYVQRADPGKLISLATIYDNQALVTRIRELCVVIEEIRNEETSVA